jgi:hypothetical protein
MIINNPGGGWYCNDDSSNNTLNPMVDFSNPPEGQYDIWIGSFGDDIAIGTLYIAEGDFAPTETFSSVPSPLSETFNSSGPGSAPATADFSAYTYGSQGNGPRAEQYCSDTSLQVGQYVVEGEDDPTWILSGFQPSESFTALFYWGSDPSSEEFVGSVESTAIEGSARLEPPFSTTAIVVYGRSSECLVSWPPYVQGEFGF